MNLVWRVIYTVIIGVLLWILHSQIGNYPEPLPRSQQPKREMWEVMLFWGSAMVVPILMMYAISPWLERTLTDRTLRELVRVPLLSGLYVALPLVVVLKQNRWATRDLGLSLRSQSRDVSVFAVVFGSVSGSLAFFTGQTVVGLESQDWGELLLLIYNNAFIEEFYFRGVIQTRLEKAFGQVTALSWGGILYGSTHIALDISALAETGLIFIFFALLLQTMAGWLLGLIFMKTRSLWPGVACHYMVNWLPSILAGLAG